MKITEHTITGTSKRGVSAENEILHQSDDKCQYWFASMRAKRMRNAFLKIAAGTLAVTLGVTACTTKAAQTSTGKITEKKVERGNLVVGVRSDGAVTLPVTNLNFEVGGKLAKVYFSVGDAVKKGDLLAELDGTDYKLAIETAQNNLNKANANYDDAVWNYEHGIKSDEVSLKNAKTELDKGFDDYQYKTAIEDAKANVQKRTEELDKAKKDAENPLDTSSYERQLADAKENLDKAKADAAEPFDDFTYQRQIADAEDKIRTATEDLEKATKDAGEAGEENFDDYSLQKNISAAENEVSKYKSQQNFIKTQVEGLIKNGASENSPEIQALYKAAAEITPLYNSAYEKLQQLEFEYNNSYNKYLESLDSTKESAAEKVKSAKKALDSAQQSYSRLAEDLEKAKLKYNDEVNEKLVSAQKNYDRLKEDYSKSKTNAEEDAQDKLTSAQKNLDDANKSLARAEENYERALTSYRESQAKMSSSYALQLESYNKSLNSNLTIKNAETSIKEAQLKLDEEKSKLEKTKIYSPQDGKILSVLNREGETITEKTNAGGPSFGTSGSSSNFMTICDPNEIYIKANITEGDIVSVTEGQKIRVTFDSFGDETFDGKVTSVSSLPTTSNGITTYAVTCQLDQANPQVKDGMNAQIEFIQLEHPDVLMIPNKAVSIDKGKQYVNVVTEHGGKKVYEKRAVTCGLSNGTYTEVSQGLEEGETVAVGKVAV